MALVRYKALTAEGAIVTGEIDAPSAEAAVAELQLQGHYPLQASPANNGFPLDRWLARRRARSKQGLTVALHELGTLLAAGLPLARAMEIVVGLAGDAPLGQAFSAALGRVRGGATLADALERSAVPLPRMAYGIIRAGESGGGLPTALGQLGEYMTRAEELREAIKSALVYPILLLATAGLSLMFILTDVLPEFEPLFAEAGKALPLPTRIVMAIGYLVGHWGWLAALGAAAGYVTLRRWLRNPATRRRVDTRILRVPLFGRLAMEIEAARFARSLGTITRAGLPLPAAMALASETLGNTAIRHTILEAAVRMREGERLSEVLKRDRLLPPLAAQLAEVGEESGKLEDMLLHQAELFEREVRRTVERLLAALVPGLTIVLGLMVAGIIASVLVAILKVNELAL